MLYRPRQHMTALMTALYKWEEMVENIWRRIKIQLCRIKKNKHTTIGGIDNCRSHLQENFPVNVREDRSRQIFTEGTPNRDINQTTSELLEDAWKYTRNRRGSHGKETKVAKILQMEALHLLCDVLSSWNHHHGQRSKL